MMMPPTFTSRSMQMITGISKPTTEAQSHVEQSSIAAIAKAKSHRGGAEARSKAKTRHECSTPCQEDSQPAGKPPATDAHRMRFPGRDLYDTMASSGQARDLDDEKDSAGPVAVSVDGDSGG